MINLFKNKYFWLVVILIAFVIFGFVLSKKNKNLVDNFMGPDFINHPPYQTVDWISGEVIDVGGNYFDLQYNDAAIRVAIIDETKFVDQSKQSINGSINLIKIGETVSVQTMGSRIFVAEVNGSKKGYTQASSIFIGEMK
jgi:hypothetical protein